MKTCLYCGGVNEDSAATCLGCGRTEFKAVDAAEALPAPASEERPPVRLRDIATDPLKLFRALVVVSTVVYVIVWFHWYFTAEDLADALAWNGYGVVCLFHEASTGFPFSCGSPAP